MKHNVLKIILVLLIAGFQDICNLSFQIQFSISVLIDKIKLYDSKI